MAEWKSVISRRARLLGPAPAREEVCRAEGFDIVGGLAPWALALAVDRTAS